MTDRAVSITLNYVLALGISTVLITGLIVAGGGFVQDQRERVVEAELSVIGQHIAGNVEQVDRLVRAGGSTETAYINQSLPERVAGAAYTVKLAESPEKQVILNATNPDVVVRVNVTAETDLDPDGAAAGGDLSVAYDPGEDEVVIRNV